MFNGTRIRHLDLYTCNERYLESHETPISASSNPDEFLHSPPPLEIFFKDHTFVFPTAAMALALVSSVASMVRPRSPLASLKHLQMSFRVTPYVAMVRDLLLDSFNSLESLRLPLGDPNISVYPIGPVLENIPKLKLIFVGISPPLVISTPIKPVQAPSV
ncbi:unnamed protein product [Cyclocybe aegerita]|uniref:Uncharacterized protein n=1 Tax=Cyclocybe aegerita TaxID=1973307 RepID=A0A8S0W650_CYCAE|nr:unnamed protein product [Cyclocybe aegerita]